MIQWVIEMATSGSVDSASLEDQQQEPGEASVTKVGVYYNQDPDAKASSWKVLVYYHGYTTI